MILARLLCLPFLAIASAKLVQFDEVATWLAQQIPGKKVNLIPFEQIADEIQQAERFALDLEAEVGDSSAEKASVQWFMATAMRELTKLKKDVLNKEKKNPPSLANKYEQCYAKTVAEMPEYDEKLTLGENLAKDKSLAPDTIEAHMYDVYEAEYKLNELTKDLGECWAGCPTSAASLLATEQKTLRGRSQEDPKKMMSRIADAIYNTTESINRMEAHLDRDRASMDVLESISTTVMQKLLKAQRDVETMEAELDDCLKLPAATKLHSEVMDVMEKSPEFSEELIDAAKLKSDEVKQEVKKLEAKLLDCHKRCRP